MAADHRAKAATWTSGEPINHRQPLVSCERGGLKERSASIKGGSEEGHVSGLKTCVDTVVTR